MMRALVLVSLALVACRPGQKTPPQPASADPNATLDSMDRRTPVPLLPMMALHQKENMRDHLEAVQQIVAGLVANDFDEVERGAARIGSSEEMGRMCEHMGAGAPGFTEQALGFHSTADTIGEAARNKDPTAVLRALNATLQTCTACHAAWKQQVVDEATFTRLSGGPNPHH